jgi:osmotically-inducible protein OsmY
MQEAERIQTEIQKVLGDDPTIQDASRIIVMVEKKSFWKGGKEIVVLKGSVRSESDKAKAERIAQLHSAGREVQDAITVIH